MDILSFTTSTNALLVQKSGSNITPIQTGQLAVVLYTNGIINFDIAGSSFELLPGTKILYQTEKDYKQCYHFVSDPIRGTILILKVNQNYQNIDNIFKQGVQLVPKETANTILNSSSFKSITKSDPTKYPSIKFTQSQTIGGTINPPTFNSNSNTNNSSSSKTQPSIKPLETKNPNQGSPNILGNALGAVPKGVNYLGQGVNTVGKTVGETANNLLGGVVGGLANIGQGVYNGVKNGVTQ